MARIPLDPPRTLVYRLAEWYSRRSYDTVAEPLAAMGHNPRVLMTDARFETSLARWKRLDPTLKALAEMAAAVTIGCSWCVDFGYWVSTRQGVDPAKLRDVPPLAGQRRLHRPGARRPAYAEAMTATPPAVTDEMVAGLRRELDDAELVELTMMVAVENVRSRFNSALGLTSQGFKDRCEIPARGAGDRPRGAHALAAFDRHRRLLFTRRLPDAGQRRRRRGRRPGHLAALVGGRPRRRRRPAGLPGADHHPAGARPAGLGAGAAGDLRRPVAARAAADRRRAGRRGPRRRSRRRPPSSASRCRWPCWSCWRRSPRPSGRSSSCARCSACRSRRSPTPLDRSRGRRPAARAPGPGARAGPPSAASTPTAQTQRQVTEQFLAACAGGDVDALLAALAPDVVAVSDGGGKVKAARRPIAGADKVARFLVGDRRRGAGAARPADRGDRGQRQRRHRRLDRGGPAHGDLPGRGRRADRAGAGRGQPRQARLVVAGTEGT